MWQSNETWYGVVEKKKHWTESEDLVSFFTSHMIYEISEERESTPESTL